MSLSLKNKSSGEKVYSDVLLQEIERLKAEVRLQEITNEKLRWEIKELSKKIAEYRMILIGRPTI